MQLKQIYQRSLKKIYKKLINYSIFHPMFRKIFANQYLKPQQKKINKWIFQWNENDNFYYDLTDRNKLELCSLISIVTGKEFYEVKKYMEELENNFELRNDIESIFLQEKNMRDFKLGYGRRIGWYVFVRILKPKIIVETGIHHGLGARVLTAALIENAKEGNIGKYYGTDIDLKAGMLLTKELENFAEILYGDSVESLLKFNNEIDLFINDSDHSADYEALEYETILKKLSPKGLILGDNSHVTTKLLEFSQKNSRPYLIFREDPKDHWYPGAGIGISPPTIPLL